MMTKLRLLALAAAAGVVFAPPPSTAASYPDKTVSIIIPLGAGGAMDRVTRVLAEQMSKRLGQPVIVENRPGGGMVIGATAVKEAAPDGHTLMNAPSGAYAINPTLFKQLAYDPEKDFVPVAMYATLPFVLVVNPSMPVKSVKELIKYTHDNPGKVSYAASGRGGVIHLAGEMLMTAADIKMTSVPYQRGGPQALNDVVAGHVPVTFADPSLAPGLIAAGKIRALGVSSKTRMPTLPDVPTLDEAGVKGFEAVSWHLIVAPAKTPKAVIDKLNAEIKAVVAMPEIDEKMRKMGLVPVATPASDALQKFVHEENKRWGAIVRKTGIAGSL
jgi:tripartite-type tricarboxylate transporter receptor subunit TctC